jgi:ATP-dependent protease ClpP protease subunit
MNKITVDGDSDLMELEENTKEKFTPMLSPDGTYLNLYIQGAVTDDSIIPIIDAINTANVKLADQTDHENELVNLQHINLFICSQGGNLNSTSQLLTAMDCSKIPIRTIGWGECMSAGGIILMAGHERLVSPNLTVMVHNASLVTLSGTQQHVSDKSTVNMFKATEKLMHYFYLKYTGKTLKYIKQHLMKSSRDDVYFLGEEAIKHCIADAVYSTFNQLTQTPNARVS